jgi:predicted phosphodiesterase
LLDGSRLQLVEPIQVKPAMRLAIISDIHGNLEAFRQVLADIDQSGVDATVCLGDNVGYGPEPEQVVRLLRRRRIPSVMGNHELGVVDNDHFHWFNTPAQQSLLITRRLLTPETLDYIGKLPASLTVEECLCVHGSPPDSITTYLYELSTTLLRSLFQDMREQLCFVGHTHELAIVGFDGHEVSGTALGQGLLSLPTDQKCIINVGSVGQPRDGNNNAKYVIWDDTGPSIEVRFVPYNIEATAKKIVQLGFPEHFARRLW